MNDLKEGFGISGKFKIITRDSKTGVIKRETPWYSNLMMFSASRGRDLFLKRMSGDNTYTLNVTACKIGTSSTAPTIADTDLGAAVATATSPVISQASNVLTFFFFFADANLANGTYNEVGTFVDATRLFNRAVFATPYVKASGEDTTIQVDFTSN